MIFQRLEALAQVGDVVLTPDEAEVRHRVDEALRLRDDALLDQEAPELARHLELLVDVDRLAHIDRAVGALGRIVQLAQGRVAGAGIDVFWREPFDPEDPLLKLNVIPTPHIGGSTERSLTGIGQAVASNIEMLKRGELPSNCANPEAYGSRQRS